MSQTSSKQVDKNTEEARKKKGPLSFLFDMSKEDAAMWAPYGSVSDLLLSAQRNTRAFIQINRKLADEFRDIARRQQDMALDLTAKMLNRTSEAADSSKPSGAFPNIPINEYFDLTMSGAREFGKVLAEAQSHSLETMRGSTGGGAKENARSSKGKQTA